MAETCSFYGTEIKENEPACFLCGAEEEKTSAPIVEKVNPEPVAAAPAMEESKFVCPGCGKEYPAGTKFCAECGGKIEEKKSVIDQKEKAPKFICSGCGKEYPVGTKFCTECGGKIEEVKPAIPFFFACTGCGKEYPAGTRFCAECGNKVKEKNGITNDKSISRDLWLQKQGGLVTVAIEHMKNADLQFPSAIDAAMAASCADLDALIQMQKNGFSKWNQPDIISAACCTPFCSIVQFIHQLGGDVNAKTDDGWTPLSYAAICGHLDIVKYLVSQGANVNAKTYDGQTPLHRAARCGHLDIAKYLVSQGADVNAKDDSGWTPLFNAVRPGHLDIVKYLVSQGVDVNAKLDGALTTPLHYAAADGYLDIAKYLVSQRADVNVKANDGQTALDCAIRNNNDEIADFLKQHGAVANLKHIIYDLKNSVFSFLR